MKKVIISMLILSSLGLIGCSNVILPINYITEQQEIKTKTETEILEEENDKKLEEMLIKVSFDYGDTMVFNSYLYNKNVEVIPFSKEIEYKTFRTKIGGTNNYVATIGYTVKMNSTKGYFYLRILLENNIDENGNLIPLGYSVLKGMAKESFFDASEWVELDDSVGGTTLKFPRKINLQTGEIELINIDTK